MPSVLASPTSAATIADLLEALGGIDPRRVLLQPPPGTASEADLIKANDHAGRFYELVDGTLVEKATGYPESLLAGFSLHLLRDFFASWDRFPGRTVPKDPIPDLVPDWAIEVLSKGTTRKEIACKLREYFEAGVRLARIIDPKKRTVAIYQSPSAARAWLGKSDTLDGGEVVPGFTLNLANVFSELDRQG